MFNLFKKIRKRNYVILAILIAIFLGNVMFTTFDSSKKANIDKEKYAGSTTCISCHKSIYDSYIKTAHYLDSRPASRQAIKGSFIEGKNKFVYNNVMEVVLERKKNTFFQTAYMNGIEIQSEPFDVVIGSGRKGQTYLSWHENKLYQLPVSYYTPLNNWCNSPGFPTNYIRFDRVIPSQCLECHGTDAKVLEDKDNISTYDKNQIILGIQCERCHGPSADHVAFHQQHSDEKKAKYLISIEQLSRQQRLDGCALCHSGFRKPIQPAFSFKIGDKLDEFSIPGYNNDSISTLDVHGNQYGLLMASKCFKMSQLDCSSCHNVHVNEANSPKIFSQRCITCHTDTKHTTLMLSSNQKKLLTNNCTDCHMPMLPSKKIVLTVANSENIVPDMVRTHRVGIYPEKTKEFLEKMK